MIYNIHYQWEITNQKLFLDRHFFLLHIWLSYSFYHSHSHAHSHSVLHSSTNTHILSLSLNCSLTQTAWLQSQPISFGISLNDTYGSFVLLRLFFSSLYVSSHLKWLVCFSNICEKSNRIEKLCAFRCNGWPINIYIYTRINVRNSDLLVSHCRRFQGLF